LNQTGKDVNPPSTARNPLLSADGRDIRFAAYRIEFARRLHSGDSSNCGDTPDRPQKISSVHFHIIAPVICERSHYDYTLTSSGALRRPQQDSLFPFLMMGMRDGK
jgi:hypothetical protein